MQTTTVAPINMQSFEEVMETKPLVVLDFWAAWCAPCKILAPVYEELAKHNPDIFFGKVDTEEVKDLAEAFQIRSIPTLMGFKNGELAFEHACLLPPHELEKLLTQLRNFVPEPIGEESFE